MKKLNYLMLPALCCATLWSAEWPTDGGGPRRIGWQTDEHILTKENAKDLQILWKLKFDNKPREMHSLFPPLIVENINTSAGRKQIAIEAGISDNIYAIDVDAGEVLWQKHFEYPPITEGRGMHPGDPLCPGGQTATPIIGPPNASGDRTLYALAGNGDLHTMNVADGKEITPPVRFGFPNGKSYALNMWNSVIFTTTSQSCN